MAKKNVKKGTEQTDEQLVDVVSNRDQGMSAQDWLENNQNLVFGVLAAVIIAVAGYFIYQNLVVAPQQQDAVDRMYAAQQKFEQDSFQVALVNPGGIDNLGFLDIIDEYGATPAGNLARYYAGVSYLNLGDFNAAKVYLEEFDPAGDVTPIMKYGALGDVESELGNFAAAIKQYQSAVSAASDNELLAAYYLKKLGLLYENQQRPQDALEAYSRIKQEYPNAPASVGIDKYIARAEAATAG
jgi:tetratricopeptide (TPR) repeat protein